MAYEFKPRLVTRIAVKNPAFHWTRIVPTIVFLATARVAGYKQASDSVTDYACGG